jgi:hypothetical protein
MGRLAALHPLRRGLVRAGFRFSGHTDGSAPETGPPHHPSHTVQTRALHLNMHRRKQNARHPDVLTAQQRERARIRSEKAASAGAGRPLKRPDRRAVTVGDSTRVASP